MQSQYILMAAHILFVYIMPVVGVTIEENTCDICPAPHRHRHITDRFKACKLVSVRTTLDASLDIINSVKAELISSYPMSPDEVNSPIDRNNYITLDAIMNTTYTRVQQIYLEERFVDHFNRMYQLGLDTTSLPHHLQTTMCRILPVLRHGHVYHQQGPVRCTVSESVTVWDRSTAINIVVNFLRSAGHDLELLIESINNILVTPRIYNA